MLRLYHYEDDCPEGIEVIKDNVTYFANYTMEKLDKRLDGLLKHTDGATYVDSFRFMDKYGFTVPWFNLSTGGMTILNIFYNTDKCFWTGECGENALADLKNLQEGMAYPFLVYDYDGDDKCNIILCDDPDWVFTSIKGLHEGKTDYERMEEQNG